MRDDENFDRMAKWREDKEVEWAETESVLRKKHPERAGFEAWMTRQCDKALRKVQSNDVEGRPDAAWSVGLSKADQYEWLSNCYQMRCDDDYALGGGYLHGPYDAHADPESLTTDFIVFCLLAKRGKVLPADWSWSQFLAKASHHVAFAFEPSDAQERWGRESVFSVAMGGRSLRYTAEKIYRNSCQAGGLSRETKRAQREAEMDSTRVLNEIGGREVWDEFTDDILNRRTFAY